MPSISVISPFTSPRFPSLFSKPKTNELKISDPLELERCCTQQSVPSSGEIGHGPLEAEVSRATSSTTMRAPPPSYYPPPNSDRHSIPPVYKPRDLQPSPLSSHPLPTTPPPSYPSDEQPPRQDLPEYEAQYKPLHRLTQRDGHAYEEPELREQESSNGDGDTSESNWCLGCIWVGPTPHAIHYYIF